MSKTISFTDNSSNVSTWLWNFGDGNTSTEQNPIHTFETFGSYMVTLTVTDGMGNADETQQFIEITDTSSNQQEEQQEEQQQEEQQEEQQTYSEPAPSSPPAGYNPQMGMFQTDALSPEGQWIWSGFGWVENGNYVPPETTTDDETDNNNTEESEDTSENTGDDSEDIGGDDSGDTGDDNEDTGDDDVDSGGGYGGRPGITGP